VKFLAEVRKFAIKRLLQGSRLFLGATNLPDDRAKAGR